MTNFIHPMRQRGIRALEAYPADVRQDLIDLRNLLPTVDKTLTAVMKITMGKDLAGNHIGPEQQQLEVIRYANGTFDDTDTHQVDQVSLGRKRLLMGQRGIGKTTLLTALVLHRWIHDLDHIALVVSSTEDIAKEIATGITAVMHAHPAWGMLTPNDNSGGAFSVSVNKSLNKNTKSKSLTCKGAKSAKTGLRADMALIDDLEQPYNCQSLKAREELHGILREVNSIVIQNEVLVIGTPHHLESLYSNLPVQGYDCRMWPGRVPSLNGSRIEAYGPQGAYLAPSVMALAQDDDNTTGNGLEGNLGICTVEPRLGETYQLEQEKASAGSGGYELQQLLDITKAEQGKYPLNIIDLLTGHVDKDFYEATEHKLRSIKNHNQPRTLVGGDRKPWRFKIAAIDPAVSATKGKDALAMTCAYVGVNTVQVVDVKALDGGFSEENVKLMIQTLFDNQITRVYIEINQGGGLIASTMKRALQDFNNPRIVNSEEPYHLTFIEQTSRGMKEKRIVDVLAPFLSSHRLVFSDKVMQQDRNIRKHYADERRGLVYQLTHITAVRGSLSYDDNVDNLAMVCQAANDLYKGMGSELSHEAKVVVNNQREIKRRVKAGLQKQQGGRPSSW